MTHEDERFMDHEQSNFLIMAKQAGWGQRDAPIKVELFIIEHRTQSCVRICCLGFLIYYLRLSREIRQ